MNKRGIQKEGLAKFYARFLAFCNAILRVQKKCCPRAEDRAIFEDLRLRGQGQELQNVSSASRTSSKTLPLLPGPDAFGMRQQSGEYFAPKSMLSSFSMPTILGIKTKKINEVFIAKSWGTWSVVMFHIKAFVVTSYWQKFAGFFC